MNFSTSCSGMTLIRISIARTKKLLFVLAMVLLIPLTASAQTIELVQNGTFDADTDPWQLESGKFLDWIEFHGNPVGSVFISGQGELTASNVCVDLSTLTWPDVGGVRYFTLAADIFNSTENAGSPEGYLTAETYSDTSCTTASGSVNSTAAGEVGDGNNPVWQPVSSTFTLDVDDMSILIQLRGTSVDEASYSIGFDNITAYSSTPNAIILTTMKSTNRNEFDANITPFLFATCVVFFTLAVFAVLGRFHLPRN